MIMLFSSYEFIFFFLPVVLIGYFYLSKFHVKTLSISWLVFCSLVYYSWLKPIYLLLMLFSIFVNYILGDLLGKKTLSQQKKIILILGIIFNLGLLGYYKYTNFIIDTVNELFTTDYSLQKIILPLAISFFTFQQIAYLVDSYEGKTKHYTFLNYCLFVCFFPQLVAGPIVHHMDVMPQFNESKASRFSQRNFSLGLTVFIFGVFKKIMIADYIGTYADQVFGLSLQGDHLLFWEAWGGALAYTMQIYFDFSGYSDMAIGLGNMFGIKLPINFNSPYKSKNIIDFWRRWHITLSTFLRDYLYIPLGGNRKGKSRRYINLFLTMLLGGLWHGAGWNFVLWGALHGTYLMINHGWKKFGNSSSSLIYKIVTQGVTFLCVVFAWVFFRAETFASAKNVILSMTEFSSVSVLKVANGPFNSKLSLLSLIVMLFMVWFLPNVYEWLKTEAVILDRDNKGLKEAKLPAVLKWQPNLIWAGVLFVMMTLAVINMSKSTAFIYFQF